MSGIQVAFSIVLIPVMFVLFGIALLASGVLRYAVYALAGSLVGARLRWGCRFSEDPRLQPGGRSGGGRPQRPGLQARRPCLRLLRFQLGAHAEYLRLPAENELATRPSTMTCEEAATVPYGALVALHYLRDAGRVQGGPRVLIAGASGSVGTYATQLACSLGAEVTGVCSARNSGLVKVLGATETIDYRTEELTARGGAYDLIFDAAGKASAASSRTALAPGGRYLTIMKGGPSKAERVRDLRTLTEMIEAGHLRALIDRCYPLEQIVEAHRHAESGAKQGSVVVTMP